MNDPARLAAIERQQTEAVLSMQRQAEQTRQDVAALEGVPGRAESALIPALQKEAGRGNWVMQGLWSLRNPNEMATMMNYYERTAPDVAETNLRFGIANYAPLGTESAWQQALSQVYK